MANGPLKFFFWKAVLLITLCREGPFWPEGRHRAREPEGPLKLHGLGCRAARSRSVFSRGRRGPGRGKSDY